MNQRAKVKRALPWWRRILLALVSVAIVVLIGFMLANYIVARQLGGEIAKISQAGEPLSFAELSGRQNSKPTGAQAERIYHELLDELIQNDPQLNVLLLASQTYRQKVFKEPGDGIPEELAKIVASGLVRYSSILEKIHKAGELELPSFDMGLQDGTAVYKGRLGRFQKAVLLISLQTMSLVHSGRGSAAAQSAISTLKMTRVYDFQPIMLIHSAKAAGLMLACDDIGLILKHMRLSQDTLSDLQNALSQAAVDGGLEKMYLVERVYQTELVRNFLPDQVVTKYLSEIVPTLPERFVESTSSWRNFRIRQKSIQYYRDLSEFVELSRAGWPMVLDKVMAKAKGLDNQSSKLISNSMMIAQLTADMLAVVRYTQLGVAIEQYRLKHNKPPESLDLLVPDYIETVPVDPYSGEAILYKQEADSVVVYSVGRNRRDDHGAVGVSDRDRLDRGLRIPLQRSK